MLREKDLRKGTDGEPKAAIVEPQNISVNLQLYKPDIDKLNQLIELLTQITGFSPRKGEIYYQVFLAGIDTKLRQLEALKKIQYQE